MSSARLCAFPLLALFFLVARIYGNVQGATSPSQIRVTKRPEPIVRYSDTEAAHVNAQILMPLSSDYTDVFIMFYYGEKSDGSVRGQFVYWYHREDDIRQVENRNGLKIRFGVEEVPGFIKFDVAIEAQLTGLLTMKCTTAEGYEFVYVEVLNQQQQIWMEDVPYQIGFILKEHHGEIGEEFKLLCIAYGAYITPEDVRITKEGLALPDSRMDYKQRGRASVIVSYRVDGFEEGEYECSFRDEVTGTVETSVTSVVRN